MAQLARTLFEQSGLPSLRPLEMAPMTSEARSERLPPPPTRDQPLPEPASKTDIGDPAREPAKGQSPPRRKDRWRWLSRSESAAFESRSGSSWSPISRPRMDPPYPQPKQSREPRLHSQRTPGPYEWH